MDGSHLLKQWATPMMLSGNFIRHTSHQNQTLYSCYKTLTEGRCVANSFILFIYSKKKIEYIYIQSNLQAIWKTEISIN